MTSVPPSSIPFTPDSQTRLKSNFRFVENSWSFWEPMARLISESGRTVSELETCCFVGGVLRDLFNYSGTRIFLSDAWRDMKTVEVAVLSHTGKGFFLIG